MAITTRAGSPMDSPDECRTILAIRHHASPRDATGFHYPTPPQSIPNSEKTSISDISASATTIDLAGEDADDAVTDTESETSEDAGDDHRTAQNKNYTLPQGSPKIINHIVHEACSKITFRAAFPAKAGVYLIDETTMQKEHESLVLDYWDNVGGRIKTTGFTEHWVLDIVEHREITKRRRTTPPMRKRRARSKSTTPMVKVYEFRTQWVGFSSDPDDTSWERAELLRDTAKEIFEAYVEENGLDI